MKYCRYCGGEVSDTARACGHCGRWLASEPATPPPGVPEQGRQVESESVVSSCVRPLSPESPRSEQAAGVPPATEGMAPEPPSAERQEVQPAAVVQPVEAASPVERDVKRKPPAPSPAQRPDSPQKPRRSTRLRVWGLAIIVIIVVVGAALVMNSIRGPGGQQAAQPRSTSSLVATAGVPRSPSSVPTPGLQSVTVLLGRSDATKTIKADQPVVVEWAWGVCGPALLEENIAAVDFKVSLDGFVLATGEMAKYRTEVREEDITGIHAWWQYYAYPLGTFRSGSSHHFELERGFSQQVTDGCDLDGDGNPDWYGPDSVTTTRLDLAVR
jgi:hypothetical protein